MAANVKGGELETPRTNYDRRKNARGILATSIILTLDSTQINKIKNDFMWGVGKKPNSRKRPRSHISITGFIEIMMDSVRAEDFNASREEMISSLMELFDQMDLDGNGTLDFKEFLATIVHLGLSGADKLVLNPIKQYVEGPCEKNQRNPTKQFCKYIPSLNRVMIKEGQAGVIKFVDVDNFKKVKKAINLDQKGILGCEFIDMGSETQNLIATATTQHLTFWGNLHTSRVTMMDEIMTRQPQTCIKWISKANALFTGTSTGRVHWWKVSIENGKGSKGKCSRTRVLHTFQGHEGVVTAIQMIPSMDLLLTASLDTTVRLWDLVKRKEKFKFCGHNAGVVDLAYSEEYRFLLSAGIDHDVCVWSPFADRLVFKLKGHGSPLVGVEFVTGTPQIVTADAEGWIKIWDARNFACVQTFLTTNKICGFATTSVKHKRMLVSSLWSIFSFDQEGGPYCKIEGEDKETMVVYNEKLLSFLTGGVEMVKVWNALNGKIVKMFRGLVKDDISCMCLDQRGRKFIIGTLSGQLEVYNYQNGQHMKTLQGHKGEIIHLAYGVNSTLLVSIGADHIIQVHDEGPVERSPVLVTIPVHLEDRVEILGYDVSFTMRLVALGCNDGSLHIWDIDTGKLEHTFHEVKDRSCVKFLGNLPLIAAADEEGEVKVYVVRPWNTHTHHCMASFQNTPSDEADEEGEIPHITSLAFSGSSNTIFTGEDNGWIKAWDISAFVNKIGLVPIKVKDDMNCNPLHLLSDFCNTTTGALSSVPYGRMDIKPLWKKDINMKVRTIQVSENPQHLLLTPLDTSAPTLLSFEGKIIGKLKKSSLFKALNEKKSMWDFHPDVEALHHKSKCRMDAVTKQIEAESKNKGAGLTANTTTGSGQSSDFQKLKENMLARISLEAISESKLVDPAPPKRAHPPKRPDPITRTRQLWKAKKSREPFQVPALGETGRAEILRKKMMEMKGRPSSILTRIGKSLTGEDYFRNVSPPSRKSQPLHVTLKNSKGRTSSQVSETRGNFALEKGVAESMNESQRYAALNLHEAMMTL